MEELPVGWTSHELREREANMLRRTLTVLALAVGVNLPAAAQEPSEQFVLSGSGRAPAVASGAGGEFVVVWTTQEADGGVVGQRFDGAGMQRGEQFVVSASGGGAKVAVAADGSFAVVWTHSGVFARRYDAAGTPLDASGFRISSSTSNRISAADVSADSAGNFVVVGTDQAQDQGDVFAWRFDAAGHAIGSEFRVHAYTTAGQYAGAVVAAPDGGFVVVWRDGRYGTADSVFARRFDIGGDPLGDDFRVNGYTGGSADLPDVAVDGSGNFVVVWRQDDGSSHGTFGQRFDRFGNRLGTPFLANSQTLHEQRFPSVAAAPGGGFVVAWMTEFSDNWFFIRAQRFQADGLKSGNEIQVNSLYGFHAFPEVAARGDDRFVVVWHTWDDKFDPTTSVIGKRYGDHVFFSDGFETGDTSRWSGAASDGGDLAVTGAAGMKGTPSGLQAFVDDTKGLFVQDDTPTDEFSYRARFYFNTGDFDPGESMGAHRTRIFIAFEEDPTRRLLAVVLRRIAGQYSLRARVRRDDDSRFDTPFVDIQPGVHVVEIRWVRASAPGANDGIFQFHIDQVLWASTSTLDNNRSAIDFVRLGALSVKNGASGTLYFDEFESRKEFHIGP